MSPSFALFGVVVIEREVKENFRILAPPFWISDGRAAREYFSHARGVPIVECSLFFCSFGRGEGKRSEHFEVLAMDALAPVSCQTCPRELKDSTISMVPSCSTSLLRLTRGVKIGPSSYVG